MPFHLYNLSQNDEFVDSNIKDLRENIFFPSRAQKKR